MKEKDEIKELFKESFENYSSNVDPSVWNAVQAGIGNAAASGGSGFLAGVSSTAKIVSSVIVASSIITATAIYITSDDVSQKENTIEYTVIEQTKEDKREESLVAENEDENSVSNENRQTKNITKTDNLEIVDNIIESKEGQEATDFSKKQDDNHLPDTKNSGHNSSGSVSASETSTNTETTNSSGTQPGTQKTEQTSSSASTEMDSSIPVERASEEPFQLNVVFEQLRNQQIRIQLDTSELDDFWIDVGDGTEFRSDIVEHWYEEAGEYEVLVTGKIGEEYYYETHLVKVEVVGKINNLPNVFTPDGDGLNDYLFIDSEGLSAFQITVFNSKRVVVYESNDVDFKWYGEDIRNQQKVEKGNYYYIIIARDKLGNVIHKHQTLSVIY